MGTENLPAYLNIPTQIVADIRYEKKYIN